MHGELVVTSNPDDRRGSGRPDAQDNRLTAPINACPGRWQRVGGPVEGDTTMTVNDPLHRIAEQVADCFADSGYAFVEQDKIDGLAIMLNSFLTIAGIPVNPPKENSASRERDL
jgi:hypothetical protein